MGALVVWGIQAWLIAVALLIAYRLLTGGISTTHLLSVIPGGPPSLERVQLILSTILVLAAYVAHAVSTFDSTADSPVLPDAPTWVIAVMGGSNTVYLGGRIGRLIQAFLRRNP